MSQCVKCKQYMGFTEAKTHDAVCVPVKVRREYVWVPKDPTRAARGMCDGAPVITVAAGVKEIYTLIDVEKRDFYRDEKSPPPMDPMSIVLKHDVTMLSESQTHDWNQRGDRFHYASRYVGGDVWILVEYHDAMEQTPAYVVGKTTPPFKKGDKVRLKKGCRIDATTSPRFKNEEKPVVGRTRTVEVARASDGYNSDRPENSVPAQVIWNGDGGYWFHSSDFANMELVD